MTTHPSYGRTHAYKVVDQSHCLISDSLAEVINYVIANKLDLRIISYELHDWSN